MEFLPPTFTPVFSGYLVGQNRNRSNTISQTYIAVACRWTGAYSFQLSLCIHHNFNVDTTFSVVTGNSWPIINSRLPGLFTIFAVNEAYLFRCQGREVCGLLTGGEPL